MSRWFRFSLAIILYLHFQGQRKKNFFFFEDMNPLHLNLSQQKLVGNISFINQLRGLFPTFCKILNVKLSTLKYQRDVTLKSSCFSRAESIFGVCVAQRSSVSCCAFMASLLLSKIQIQRANNPEGTKIFFSSLSEFSLW